VDFLAAVADDLAQFPPWIIPEMFVLGRPLFLITGSCVGGTAPAVGGGGPSPCGAPETAPAVGGGGPSPCGAPETAPAIGGGGPSPCGAPEPGGAPALAGGGALAATTAPENVEGTYVGLRIAAALCIELGSEPLLLPGYSPFVTLSPPFLLHALLQFFFEWLPKSRNRMIIHI
jgi:hypothetical protein